MTAVVIKAGDRVRVRPSHLQDPRVGVVECVGDQDPRHYGEPYSVGVRLDDGGYRDREVLGFRLSELEPLDTPEHENAPEAAPTATEGESKSRANGSQNDIPTITKEQNVMSIIAPTTKPVEPHTGRRHTIVGTDFPAGREVASVTAVDPDGEGTLIKVTVGEYLTPDDAESLAQVIRIVVGRQDEPRLTEAAFAEFVASPAVRTMELEPTFPCPERMLIPSWAENVSEPTWDAPEGAWVRELTWKRAWDDGGSVNIVGASYARQDGSTGVMDVSIAVDVAAVETAEDARQTAAWLLEAADALEGPRPVHNHKPHPEPLGTQRTVAANVRRLIPATGLGQNEFAIGAGYSPDEFSTFMTGRRHMDLEDVDRIARALGVDPLSLLETES